MNLGFSGASRWPASESFLGGYLFDRNYGNFSAGVDRYTGLAGFVRLVRQSANVKRKYFKDIFGIVLPVSPGKKRRTQRPARGGLDLQTGWMVLGSSLSGIQYINPDAATLGGCARCTATEGLRTR